MTYSGFTPRTFGAQDCTDKQVDGTASTIYSYIQKVTSNDTSDVDLDLDVASCPLYYHSTAQIDSLRINTELNGAGNINITGAITTTGSVTAATATIPTITGTASGNKLLASFDIPHVKQKGKRIRHIITEGPEAGIYIRGKLKNANTINLPEYWDGLIDPDSITVTLTQIGYSQDLIVEDIQWGKVVKIKSGLGANIHCYYEIWAARWLDPMNHDEKLQVVYEGETPDDYPGGNKNFLVGGWDYDRRETQWKGVDKDS